MYWRKECENCKNDTWFYLPDPSKLICSSCGGTLELYITEGRVFPYGKKIERYKED